MEREARSGATVAMGSKRTIVYLPDNLGGVDLIRRTVYGTLRKEGRLLDALAFHKEAKGVESEGTLVDIAKKYVGFDWYWL